MFSDVLFIEDIKLHERTEPHRTPSTGPRRAKHLVYALPVTILESGVP